MAYVPKDWVTGEVITEQALDHIEQGIAAIGGGVVLLNVTTDGQSTKHLGKSYDEISAIIENGSIPIAAISEYGGTTFYGIIDAYPADTSNPSAAPYQVDFFNTKKSGTVVLTFTADTSTDELVISGGPA